jgi:hypothetical protein
MNLHQNNHGKKTIFLSSPRLLTANNEVNITASFHGSINGAIWFSIDKANESWLSERMTDSFALISLYLAMSDGAELIVERSVSPLLARAMQSELQRVLSLLNPALRLITVTFEEPPAVSGSQRADGVGTGFSGGIDSWFTVLSERDSALPAAQVSHLFFNDVGQHGVGDPDANFRARLAVARRGADRLGLPLVAVRSNVDAIMPRGFQATHTLRNVAAALLFQKTIGTYLYSATYKYPEISVRRHYDMAIAEPIVLPLMSTEMTTFRSCGTAPRVEKTARVGTESWIGDALYVCVNKDGAALNCGRCFKCRRTMITLDCLGYLDGFANAFDLPNYRRLRARLIFGILVERRQSSLEGEVANLLTDLQLSGRRGVGALADVTARLYGVAPKAIRWRLRRKFPEVFTSA